MEVPPYFVGRNPVGRFGSVGGNVDVCWQVLVHRTKAIDEPTTKCRTYLDGDSSVEDSLRRNMVVAIVMQGVNETEIIDKAAVNLGEKFARVCAAFSPMLPGERRWNYRSLFGKSEFGRANRIG